MLNHRGRLNSNVIAISYWMIAHIMNNPGVGSQIREEIASVMQAIDSEPTKNGATLVAMTKDPLLNGCPVLNSTFNETLRFTGTGSGFRKSMRDTTLEGRHIPKDTIMIIPQRVQMMNTEVLGSDARAFDCHRFLRNKSLLRKGEFRGFGGGTTLCSGRIAGRHQVLAFVAQLFWRYDLEVVGHGQEVLGVRGKAFPRLNEAMPSLGPGKPINGDDMILKVTPRKL
ncbi:hypothetical protein N7474_003595 [Penicillium riverlandense]|uniref:uncharacterized protein n=1 Tax=Penicillium riverlandense TaxID=1903569 RepID=UPI0025476A39|nr:uncharacterized protein N7474_003595 [Penicillium riverlandense]KAJ5826457.1 hypothetical protein N7474_003595 [Penicillium riverlandense]